MGTNFYIRRKTPTIRECVHVCKRSFGWRTHWQATGNEVGDWPRWCDEEPIIEDHELPWAIHSVEDIRAYLETGDWELVDEYGEVYEDWKAKLDVLEKWDGGKAGWNGLHPDRPVAWETSEPRGSRDRHGNVFDEEAFA